MAQKCLTSIHVCRVRVTRLDSSGTPTAGPNNVYVTDKPMVLGVTPDVEARQEKVRIGGCDCIIARYPGRDKLKGFTFEFDLGVLEPGLLEMMLGNDAINDPDSPTDIIGNWWTDQAFDCGGDVQPNVALEAWTDGWEDDHQDADWPYIHWIWPSTRWTIAPHTLENDLVTPKVTGFSTGNPNWGVGPFHDLPEAAGRLGGWFYADEIPAALCGYQSHSIT